MSDRLPHGSGSIKRERGRFVPIMPRHLSKPPPRCKNPDDYRERLTPCATWDEAAGLLAAACEARRADPFAAPVSLCIARDAAETIERLRADALRAYGSEARANRRIATAKSLCRHWLKGEAWWELPTDMIETVDLQFTVDRMLRDGRTQQGRPVSVSFVLQAVTFLRRVFEDRGVKPNPVDSLKLPQKKQPDVPYWALRSQLQFFGAAELELQDRIMVGCGLGVGLRIGELLALEIDNLRLDAPDPYLEVRYGGPDRAPTKGRRSRRVELFEPGLGFFRLWMETFYRDTLSGLVFVGSLGGYQKHWPEQFPAWGRTLRLRNATSHIMRHTYAVSVLSGTWGYEPQSLDFVSEQLGHADRATTERYYGRYEQETWRQQVRRMTGREARPQAHEVITAAHLLGRRLGCNMDDPAVLMGDGSNSPHSPKRHVSVENNRGSKTGLGRARPNPAASAPELARQVLALLASDDPHAVRRVIELCQEVPQVEELEAGADSRRAKGGAS